MKTTRPSRFPELNEKISHMLVPIHDVRLLIVVSNSVGASRSARNSIYGPYTADCCGLCSWDEGFRVGLFFDRKFLCHELLAHEVFHATHRILQHQGTVFTPDNHEPFALLHGWLAAHTYRTLAEMKEKISCRYPKREYIPGETVLTGPHLDE